MRLIAIASVLAAGILPGAAPAAASGVLLRAEAGLGGFARPARWTPVRIEIDNKDRDLDGVVLVEWGDARVHRAIEVPAPSRTAFELYVRTADARGAMSVRVLVNGETLASAELPVRVIADGEPLVVCAGAAAPAAEEKPCTAQMTPESLPRSLRGYVAADAVRLLPGAEARLIPAQRSALQRWRAYHHGQTQELFIQAPRAPLSASAAGDGRGPAALAAATSVTLLMGAAWIWMRRHASALRPYLALAVATALGVLAAALAGRFGPGAEILMRHSTTVEQIGDGALVSMRGTIEYPAFAAYTLRVEQLDGDLRPRRAANAASWLDAGGAPMRRGTFGRGAHEEIEVDGVAEFAPFQVRVDGNVVRVQNGSGTTLTGCSFPEGFSDRRAGTLAPGTSASAQGVVRSDAPFFSCALPRPPMMFTDARFPVRVEGAGVISVRLPATVPETTLD